MLNKVRARAPIDLPVEDWERNKGLTFVLGSLVFLFILLPLVALLVIGLIDFTVATVIGVGSGIVVLLLTSIFLTPR